MKLKEYVGKEIFRKYSIPIPKGFVVSSAEQIDVSSMQEVVVKAQLLIGGRGKAGGIKFATKDSVGKVASEMLNMKLKGLPVKEVLIEEKLAIEKEMYLSMTVNRSERNITMIFSPEGGVDIEELAKTSPEKIFRFGFHEFDEKELKQSLESFSMDNCDEVLALAVKLHAIMKELDCELVEINPLVVVDGHLIAADSKVIIDDNAVFRHHELTKESDSGLTDIEQKAKSYGLNYVELDGDIAIIGNGAGLVMATLDVVDHFGGTCANFLDVGGGAAVDEMEHSLEIALMKKPKGIFINIFGGITRCDQIAQGLANYIKKNDVTIPMVVRMIGTNEADGRRILEENGIHSLDSMEKCAEKIVELCK